MEKYPTEPMASHVDRLQNSVIDRTEEPLATLPFPLSLSRV